MNKKKYKIIILSVFSKDKHWRHILTALRTGAKMLKATSQSETITISVLLRLNTRLKAIGLLIARYLSMLIAVMVKTDAATATPVKIKPDIVPYKSRI